MACDGRLTDPDDGAIFTNKATKVYRLKNGGLVGIAGDADHREIVALFNRMKGYTPPSNKQLDKLTSDFTALLALPDKTVWHITMTPKKESKDGRSEVLQIDNIIAATGSGAKYAIGALEAGASAEQAIRITIKWDSSCGGNPTVFNLEPDQKAKSNG